MLGGNRKLGETHVPVTTLLRRHARYDKDSAQVTPENILIFHSKEEKAAKASIDVWAEAYGWQHALLLLKEEESRPQILSDLERLTTRPSTPHFPYCRYVCVYMFSCISAKKDLRKSLTDAGDTKIAVYMTEDFFGELMDSLAEAVTKPSLSWRTQVFDLWKAVCNESRTRQKMIDLGVLTQFRRYIRDVINPKDKKSSKKVKSPRSSSENVADTEVKVLMLTCIKPFFSSAKGQRLIVREKILDILISKLELTTATKVLIMVCEVLRYFDGPYTVVASVRCLIRMPASSFAHGADDGARNFGKVACSCCVRERQHSVGVFGDGQVLWRQLQRII